MEELEAVQTYLRHKLSDAHTPTDFVGPTEQRTQLYDLLRRTVEVGEGNSAIIVGPRGSGKTMILNHALRQLRQEYSTGQKTFIEVPLSGLVHTTDRLALKEIARVLRVEYKEDGEEGAEESNPGTFAQVLDGFLKTLTSGSRSSTAVLFLLDEMDLFTRQGKQTLLYNLFDLSQSCSVPMGVIGVTCRLDVADLFEKRVKSRFSHRYIHVYNSLTHDQCFSLCEKTLSLESDFQETHKHLSGFTKKWNKGITEMMKDGDLRNILRENRDRDKSVRALFDLLRPTIYRLNPEQPGPTAHMIKQTFITYITDDREGTLSGLSVLELCLLIAASHVTTRYDQDTFDFETVHEEYKNFALARHNAVYFFNKSVAFKAYERLLQLELFAEVSGGVGNARSLKQFRAVRMMIGTDVVEAAVRRHPECPTAVSKWAAHR